MHKSTKLQWLISSIYKNVIHYEQTGVYPRKCKADSIFENQSVKFIFKKIFLNHRLSQLMKKTCLWQKSESIHDIKKLCKVEIEYPQHDKEHL